MDSKSRTKRSCSNNGVTAHESTSFQGWLGLRFIQRDSSTFGRTQTFGTISGTNINSSTSGVTAQYLFSSSQELVAEKTQTLEWSAINLEYYNYQVVSGIRVPLETRLLSGTNVVATRISQSQTVNPTWTSGDFAEPQ